MKSYLALPVRQAGVNKRISILINMIKKIFYFITLIIFGCSSSDSENDNKEIAACCNKTIKDTISFNSVLKDFNSYDVEIYYFNSQGREVEYKEIKDTFAIDININSPILNNARGICYSMTAKSNSLKLIEKMTKNKFLCVVNKEKSDTIQYEVFIQSDSTLFKSKKINKKEYFYLKKASVFQITKFHPASQ